MRSASSSALSGAELTQEVRGAEELMVLTSFPVAS